MKDLIFVTAYCPTDEQILRLDECINALQIDGFDLCLVSHSHTPLYIQEKCKYYIYDHLNDLSDDDDLKHFEFYFGKDFMLKSKLLKKTPFYGFAIYRMFSLVSNIALNFGYERIYHVEYDYVIKDPSIFTNHKKFLNDFDSIFYGNTKEKDPKKTNVILGGLKSFRVDKLPELFKNFNRGLMEKRIKDEKLFPLENFTAKIFSEYGNPLVIDIQHLNNRFETKKFISQELNWTLYYNQSNGDLGFFFMNYFDDCVIKITTNDVDVFTTTFAKNEVKCTDIEEIYKVKSIKIERDSIIILDTFIDEDLIEKLKTNSIVVQK